MATASNATMPLAVATLQTTRLHVDDNVVIARRQLISCTRLAEEGVTVAGMIPTGHKLAVRDIAIGEPVRRYGQIIGFASQAIRVGQHVHMHNLAMGSFDRDAAAVACLDARPIVPAAQPAQFMGIVRADGRVATRNYIGILTSVNCSATVARAIADQFRRDVRPQALADHPNIDG